MRIGAFLMTAGTAAPPSPTKPSGQQAAAMTMRPFRAGVQEVDEIPYDNNLNATTGTQDFPNYQLPSTGFLNSVWVWVLGVESGNTATTVNFANEGPYTAIDTIQFVDTNNQPILGPFTGWDLKVIDKWGGYSFQDDPQASNQFAVITGAAGTYTVSYGDPVTTATSGTGNPFGAAPAVGNAGSFQFFLRIPLEICPRDSLGSLPNKSASTPFQVKVRLAAAATPYATAPNGTLNVRIRMIAESYWEPARTDAQGNPLSPQPPAVDTTQYWQKSNYTANAGQYNQQLTSSTGFPLRNLLFYLEDSNNSRFQGESDWPDPLTLQIEANILLQRNKALWNDFIARWYSYTGAIATAAATTGAPEVVKAKEAGLYPVPFNRDFGPKPGWEMRRGYLPTTDGMRLQFRGTIGGSGTHNLFVLTNYVAPGAGATLASITA